MASCVFPGNLLWGEAVVCVGPDVIVSLGSTCKVRVSACRLVVGCAMLLLRKTFHVANGLFVALGGLFCNCSRSVRRL